MQDIFAQLILHPSAADDAILLSAIDAEKSAGIALKVDRTQSAGDAGRLAREASSRGIHRIIACGGDGTLSEFIQGIAEVPSLLDKVTIGLVPCGSGNDFARVCGIALDDPAGALHDALHTDATLIDLPSINGRPFINACSGGAGAEIVDRTPEQLKSLIGGAAYSITGLATAHQMSASAMRVRSRDFNWEGNAYIVAVGNGRSAGGGFPITNRALLNDGLLDVLIIPQVDDDQIATLLADLLRLDTDEPFERAIYRQVPELTIETSEDLLVNVDGEPLRARQFQFNVSRQVLRFALRDGAPLQKG